MTRSPGAAAGFGSRAFHRFRLNSAIAATIAIGSLSLGLVVVLTALSIRVVAAMPLPV